MDPDPVLIQELNYQNDSPGDLRDLVDLTFGNEFEFFIEPGNEQTPNDIISRYPIIAAGA